MPWLSLIIALVQAAQALFGWLRDRQLIQAGEDKAVAKAALALLEKTTEGKRLRDAVHLQTDTEEVKLWDDMLKQR